MEEVQHREGPSSPRQGPSCPQKGDILGTDVEKLLSFLSFMKQSLQPGLLLSLGSALCVGSSQVGQCLWSFNQKFPTHQNTCLQLPQAAAEAKKCFPRNNFQPLPTCCRQPFQKCSLPLLHILSNSEPSSKVPFSLREEERSQRLPLTGHKHCVATVWRAIPLPAAAAVPSLPHRHPAFHKNKSALDALTFYHCDT